jgi:diguanylate cyclase (GGDEF)-like protein/PAS domain S-box-containing protein
MLKEIPGGNISENTARQTEKLQGNGIKYQELAESITEVFISMDKNLRYTYWNKASEKLTGIPADQAVGKTLMDIFPDNEERKRLKERYLQVIETQQPQSWIEKYVGDQSFIHEINAYPTKEGVCVFVKDVTERTHAEERLRMCEAIIENSSNAISAKDLQGRYILVNKAFEERYNLSQEEIIGKTPFNLYSPEFAKQVTKEAEEVAETGRILTTERKIEFPSGEKFIFNTIIPLRDASEKIIGVYNISQDITERKAMEEEIRYTSFHDRLTELYNRRFLEEELDRLQNSRHYPITIFALDLNGLKIANDTFGHVAGDNLIQKTAAVLTNSFPRTEDFKCRIGGDEFVVIVSETNEKIIKKLAERLRLNLQNAQISASIGVSTADNREKSLRETLKEADEKMYIEKRARKVMSASTQ